uniref:Integrase core domain containing protein n=1 Tax=Solanum tuberosum TaxID=4113 RepID=M1D9P3_SOLTU
MSRIENMMQKMVRRFDATDLNVKEIRNDLSGIGQNVDAHVVSIKHLKQQMTRLSTIVNPRQPGTLPSNTIQNPKNDGNYMAVTTRGGKQTIDPHMPSGVEIENSKNDDAVEVSGESENATEKEVEVTQKVVPIPRPPSPFPQRLVKKTEEGKYRRSMKQSSELQSVYAITYRFESRSEVQIEERLGVEALAAVMMNFESNGIEEYDELVAALDRVIKRHASCRDVKSIDAQEGRKEESAEKSLVQRSTNPIDVLWFIARTMNGVHRSQSDEDNTPIGSLAGSASDSEASYTSGSEPTHASGSGSGSATSSGSHDKASSSDEATSSGEAASRAPSSSRSTSPLGAVVVPLARVQKLEAQMATLLHHVRPWMQKSIVESESRMERRMESMMDQKVQAINKRLDAFELRVVERPAPTTDLSSFQSDGDAEEHPESTRARGKRHRSKHSSEATKDERAKKQEHKKDKQAKRASIIDKQLRQERVRESVVRGIKFYARFRCSKYCGS